MNGRLCISVIGTGRMGQGLVGVLAETTAELKWGSRTISKAEALIGEHGYANVRAASMEDALDADIVIPALWYRDLLPWAETSRERLAGKIVVDIANPFTPDFEDFTTEWGTSAAEELQKALPGARVVGAFKNTFFKVLEQPVRHGEISDVYITGDDEEAKRTVMKQLRGIPFRILDGGRLRNNRTIERMTLFEREVAVRIGSYPYVSFRMFGLE